MQNRVTGQVQESLLHCDNTDMAESTQQVPEELKSTPNSTQASDYDVLAEIWTTWPESQLLLHARCLMSKVIKTGRRIQL